MSDNALIELMRNKKLNVRRLSYNSNRNDPSKKGASQIKITEVDSELSLTSEEQFSVSGSNRSKTIRISPS